MKGKVLMKELNIAPTHILFNQGPLRTMVNARAYYSPYGVICEAYQHYTSHGTWESIIVDRYIVPAYQFLGQKIFLPIEVVNYFSIPSKKVVNGYDLIFMGSPLRQVLQTVDDQYSFFYMFLEGLTRE